MPPTSPRRPGYSISVIKSYLQENGYHADIKYWNLSLRNVISHFWNNLGDEIRISSIIKDLMPFYAYYAIERQDVNACNNIKRFVKKVAPTIEINDEHLYSNVSLLKKSIVNELLDMGIEQYTYVYVQSKFYKYQLIATGVLCTILKEFFPKVITIIEAQEFERKALALMDSFNCYDFATWGEYEISLLSLLNGLENKVAYSTIPNIVYKDDNGRCVISTNRITHFIDLNKTPFADFSDYIEQTSVENSRIIFPLEGGRGCHWNQCSFCYMNDGYKYRRKSAARMRDEVHHYIKEYGAKLFYYIDNDMIGHNVSSFNKILDYYIDLKRDHDFYIDFGEVIAKDIDADIIKKMCDAGFLQIQIGYESTSDKMLKLINKKSHFSHILLVCKWCFYYGISMSPQNILRSMPFETDELILDNIKNLYYLRFLLSYDGFEHSLRELCVVSTSRYYSDLVSNNEIERWDYTPMQEFMVKDILKPEYKYDVFLMGTSLNNPLWKLFKDTEIYYKKARYRYEISKNEGGALYLEYKGDVLVRRKQLSGIEYDILRLCDRQTCSSEIIYDNIDNRTTKEHYRSCVEHLREMGLIYISDQYDEIVSTIIVSS